MNTFVHRTHRLLILIMVSVALLAATAPAPAAAQVAGATWAGWGLAVNFPKGSLEVMFATYVGRNSPTPQVLASTVPEDISGDCTIQGNLTIGDGYAIFDGNSYIDCEIPDWRTQVQSLAPYLPMAHNLFCPCNASGSPFWMSADVTLDPVASANPVFDASEVGFTFSLPSDGVTARTKVTRSSGDFLSPAWNVDTTAGNRMLVGQNGPMLVEIISYYGGLNYLTDPRWDNYFQNHVSGTDMGHWIESPSSWSKQTTPGNYYLKTGGATVHIGHNQATGKNLRGVLRKLRVDPGCFGS